MIEKRLDFVAVGSFKTGTTWIYNYLQFLPEVCVPSKVKETFFFDRKYYKGIEFYFSHFPDYKQGQLMGEVAPSYFHSEKAPFRIHQLNHQCKIIVTLREPTDRLVSYYLHMLQRGDISKTTSFREAIDKKNILFNSSRYYYHLSRWLNLFSKNNVIILFYETLKNNPKEFASELCFQLGIEFRGIPPILNQRVNEGKVPVNYALAKSLYQGIRLLRSHELHSLVNFGKNLGLQKLLFRRKYPDDNIIQTEDLNYALALISDDIKMLEKSLGLDLSIWRDSWNRKGLTFV
ncbi:MAG TPA: hypothetical protein DD379_02400 [Cyanobacteria bacterium UBA11162]|nr:hypothetical protein [Cyanobacteria bacterium UBA11162]